MMASPRRRALIALSIVALVGLGLATGVAGLRRDVRHVREDLASLRQEIAAGGLLNYTTAAALRRDVETWMVRVRRVERLTRPLAQPGRRTPAAQWAVLHDMASAGATCVDAIWWALVRMESALENEGRVSIASGAPVFLHQAPVLAAMDGLREYRQRLLVAAEAFDASAERLAGMGALAARGAGHAQAASLAARALAISPSLLVQGERAHLLLMQNSDELRATGGFISSLVALRVQDGRPLGADYMNSYDVAPGTEAHPEPPPALRDIMQASILVFRDGNWSPDYASSAEVLASLYQLDMGQAVGAVVALDTAGLRLLLASIGPVEVPGYGVTVTANNALETAIGFWEAPLGAPSLQEREAQFATWLAHRKDFGGALAAAVSRRLGALGVVGWVAVAEGIQEAIAGKHLLAWVPGDEEAQALLEQMRVAGRLSRAPGDYLMLVDSNVGWNKVDQNIERSISYTVQLAATPMARACATYRNVSEARLTRCDHKAEYLDSYGALTEQCYWNYARVLAPLGSRLRGVEGSDGQVAEQAEPGRLSWGTLVVVAPGEERTLCLTYALPADVVDTGQGGARRYRLTVQKQPGTAGVPVDVMVQVPGGIVEDAPPVPWRRLSEQEAALSDRLLTDREYALTWLQP